MKRWILNNGSEYIIRISKKTLLYFRNYFFAALTVTFVMGKELRNLESRVVIKVINFIILKVF